MIEMRCMLSTIFRVICLYFCFMILYLLWNLYSLHRSKYNIVLSKPIIIKPIGRIQLETVTDESYYKLLNVTGKLDEISCKVPRLDPFDESITDYISHPKLLVCDQVQGNETYVDINGYLRLNESDFELDMFREMNDSYSCYYSTFDRGFNDNDIVYSNVSELTEPVKLETDFVEVNCNTTRGLHFYKNIHAYPTARNDSNFGSPNETQLTVLLFFIDSVSYSNMKRNLPLTHNYTSRVMKMIYFEAFNKIGDNSFPNAMAALTGKRVFDEQDGMMKEMNQSMYESTFDSWPLIWKLFADKGYATMHNEDNPQWSLFNKGFSKKPFDFEYRTFWLALRRAARKNDSYYCFRNELKPKIMLDIMRNHLIMMNDKLQFLWTYHSELSHDWDPEIERYDDHLEHFWRDMYKGGYMNKTVVIFASDHGHRFSYIRHTLVGLLEERLPFYGIWFPEWFYKMHPKLKPTLEYNSQILSSTFDVHETLKDILNANYEGTQKNLGNRGLSQLYPIPKNRTCFSAGIPDHYCTCIRETEMDTDSPEAESASNLLVNYMNSYLNNATSLCHEIRLHKVIFFRQLDHDEKVKQGVKNYKAARELEERLKNETNLDYDFEHFYRIGISTEPMSSTFEATVKSVIVNTTYEEWRLVGKSISRTNAYKSQSDCVTDHILRKYCTCKMAKSTVSQKFNKN